MRALSLLLVLSLYGCKDDVSVDDSNAIGDDSNVTGDDSTPDDSSADDSTADDSAVGDDRDGDGSPDDEDCAPDDPAIFPGAEEACDGRDNNCDGEVDNGATGGSTWYQDTDGDTYGDDTTAMESCNAPGPDYVPLGGDCDDTDPAYNPGAIESDCADPNDYNCDGFVGFTDTDGDGFSACEECNDGDPAISPDATEVCDGVDNDCDGGVDGASAADANIYYVDTDGDSFGDPNAPVYDCSAPLGTVEDNSDCDDANFDVNPLAQEVCDGLDNNCDGSTDGPDATGSTTWYSDMDRDGYGDPATAVDSCTQPSASVADGTDCDDTVYAINPGAPEVCDGLDNNCDNSTDGADSTDATTYYLDADGDSYGDAAVSLQACSRPSGYRNNRRDCDDTNASINPGESEVCDSLDNDCDNAIDNNAIDATTYYTDADSDGYGDVNAPLRECTQPSGSVLRNDDCDDTDGSINPAATDICDGIDNDCDNVVDPSGVDTDGDGTLNCLDSTVYSTDFSSTTGWSYANLGGGNSPSWSSSNGRLGERSNAALSIATGPDLGEMLTYTITVDAMSAAAASDEAGIVFAMTSTSDFYLASWRDPNDYYGTYTNGGSVQLSHWVNGTRTVLATDNGSAALFTSYGTWITMAVEVNGADVNIYWDGSLVTTYTGTVSPLGADTVGLFTYDNDGGVYYDNLAITNP